MTLSSIKTQEPKVVFLMRNGEPSMVGAGFFNSKPKNDNRVLRNPHAYQEVVNLVVSRVCMGAWGLWNRKTRIIRRKLYMRRNWR